ncbi:MFS transporter [Caballeronia sp. LZ043]|uniref:MFS transporter n=1 Tax=Caballeronia sp. LZ043 TaxID=3038569 RepID=UPI002855BB08|nr:MFS transporter [Caballeronia sp. LZ043]MDR5822267.1 MFS transporter [Caballeronia sp. LZ043]
MNPSAQDHDTDRLMSRAMWRLVPFLCLLYFVSYLDRVNISFAALTMNEDLKFSSAVYGAGASIFFVGYLLFEVPSNLMLARFGARRWIARILVTWGALSACMAFVSGPTSFYVMRFLLGVAEAGFFPGVIYYISKWFTQHHKGRITGAFFVSLPLSSVIGAPVSTFILAHMNTGSLAGWQWMFILEGIPAVILGLLCLRLLPDRPAQARWLSADEAQLIETTLERERENVRTRTGTDAPMRSWQAVGILSMVLLLLASGIYGLGFWMPQLLKLKFPDNTTVGWLTSAIYLVGATGMMGWARFSDRGGQRHVHLAISSLVGAFGLMLCGAYSGSSSLTVIGLALGAAGILGSLVVLWTIPGLYLTGTALATGVAVINSVAQFSGIIVPWVIGIARKSGYDFSIVLYGLGGLLVLAAILARFALAAQRQTAEIRSAQADQVT